MDTNELNINISWEELREKLKEANAALSDEDLVFEPGQGKKFLERLAKKMKMDIAAAKAWVESVAFTKSQGA